MAELQTILLFGAGFIIELAVRVRVDGSGISQGDLRPEIPDPSTRTRGGRGGMSDVEERMETWAARFCARRRGAREKFPRAYRRGRLWGLLVFVVFWFLGDH